MNNEQTELTEEELPQELIDELTEHFGNVKYELGSDNDEKTHSLKAHTRISKGTDRVRYVMCDPKTFAPIAAEGYPCEMYLIRINDTDDGIILRRVIPMVVYDDPIVLGPLEPAST